MDNLRLNREQNSRLVTAFLISLLVHALIYTGYQANRRYHWLDGLKIPNWLQPTLHLTKHSSTTAAIPPAPPPELTVMPMPMAFAEVSNPSAEAPKNPKYYSSANSQAANPDALKITDAPKVTGTDNRMVKTETVTKPAPQPLRPTAAPAKPEPQTTAKASQAPAKPDDSAQKAKQAQEALKPSATLAPGDLTMARPDPSPKKTEGTDTTARPRTIKEAYAKLAQQNPQAYAGLVGNKMKQEGGVKNRNLVTSLDTKATAYGAYDAALIYAVQNRWYALLDAKGFAGEKTGKVTVPFRLYADGRVEMDMHATVATVDDILAIICQRAILDNSPYDRWPTAMRNEIGADFRDVTFTFFYY